MLVEVIEVEKTNTTKEMCSSLSAVSLVSMVSVKAAGNDIGARVRGESLGSRCNCVYMVSAAVPFMQRVNSRTVYSRLTQGVPGLRLMGRITQIYCLDNT